DRGRRDHFERWNVNHSHHLVAAHGEELLALHVDRKAGRTFARGELGPARYRGFRSIDFHDFVRGFEVHVNLAGAIDHAEFRCEADLEGRDHLIGFGVDGGGVVSAVVHGEDTLTLRVVTD